MTTRTEVPSPTTRQSLLTSCYTTAQKLIATLPGVKPLDVAVAHLGSGYALICDPAVCDHATARQILVDFVKAFDEGAGDPDSVAH